MPAGLASPVSEDAANLSAGERARLALARVVLARRDNELNHALARLRLAVEDRVDRAGLGEAVRRPLRIWVEGLPADAQVALQLLDEFER